MIHVSERSDVQYYEEVPAHPIFGIALLSTFGLMVYLGIAIPRAPKIALVFVSAMIGLIYINFMTLKITITRNRLTVGFGIIKQGVSWIT